MSVSRELLKLGEAGSGVELAVRGLGIMGDNEVEVDEKTRGTSFPFLTPLDLSGRQRLRLM